jgi:uncharacterized protein YcbK (DUF882 family)
LGTSLIDRLRTRCILAVAAILAFAHAATFTASAEERRIELFNIHTKKTIEIVFKRDGKYVPEALEELNQFLKDWRRGVATKMDPELFDLIWEMHRELGSKKPVHVISGYRSPKTNAMLRKTRGGQAERSRHMTGQAMDIHFPDVSPKQLRNSALIRERGGVGYYPTSAIPFVHVDTGGVRHWPRLPRRELAILFPAGKSKHVPTDGKPLTKKDFQVALASLQAKGGELPIAVQRRLNGGGEGRTVLASLSPKEAAPAGIEPPAQKPKMVFASLTPFEGLGRSRTGEKNEAKAAALPEDDEPIVKTGLPPLSLLRGDNGAPYRRDQLPNSTAGRPSAAIPQDQMVSAPEYDDDHPDELDYSPFPILPFMTETPIVEMDLNGNPDALDLRKVHLLYGESQSMLISGFEPGLQYAKLYWAQTFRGTAVNTQLKRLVRDTVYETMQTAQTVQK